MRQEVSVCASCSIFASVFGWGKDIISGIVNGIRSMIGSVVSAVSNVANTIRSYLHFSVPDKGPLSDADEYMPDFMNLLASGIKKNAKLVVSAVTALTSAMSKRMTDSVDDMGNELGDAVRGIASDITSSIDSLSSSAEEAGRGIQSGLVNGMTGMQSKFREIWNEIEGKKNFVLKILYELLAIVTPLVTAPYVSRILGADGVGIYSYAQSCMSYFTMFAVLGTNKYGMREIARCRNNKNEYSKKFWEIELLTVCTSAICIMAWLVLTVFSGSYKPYFIALIPMLIASMFDISWFYTGHERVGYTVFWNAVCKIAGLICIFSFIKSRNDLVLYIFLNSLILMLGNLSMWVFLPKMLVKIDAQTLNIRQHFKETLIYFMPTIAASVYTVLDKTLIFNT